MGCCKSLLDKLSDNAVPMDAAETEKETRAEHPRILREDEKVDYAFRGRGGSGRDSFMFTNKRILVRDVQGLTGSSLEYRSIPYQTIRAFAAETAGSMDRSSEIKVWASGVGKVKFSFVWDSLDIFALKRYLNGKILPKDDVGASPPNITPPEGPDPGPITKFIDFLGDNARMLDPKETEEQLRGEVDFLVADEKVEMAYKAGRDFTCFTNKRILMVDVKGMSGVSREYCSVLWEFCSAFAVETPGTFFDVDAEMTIYNRVADFGAIDQDLKKGGANLMEVQEYLSNKLLGTDTEPDLGIPATPEDSRAAGEKSNWGKAGDLMAWLGDDMKMLDPQEANAQFHAGGPSPILQGCEKVELAFKGRRDMVLFTTKRFVEVDIKGLISKSTKFTSVPWKAVKMFSAESAGSLDNDSEVKLWLEINDITPGHPEVRDHEGNVTQAEKQPVPGLSCISLDFRKDKVDLFAIQKYLAQRIIPKGDKQAYKAPEVEVNGPIQDANADTGILDWIGNNAKQIDPKQIDQRFRSSPPILLSDETTVMAFKCGRDLTFYTTKRIVKVDTQGITGKRVEYLSVPYASIKAFSVESAGSWDRDAEAKIYINSPWMPAISQDFRKGQADIIALQSLLAAQVIGNEDGSMGLSGEGVKAAAEAAEQAAAKSGPVSRFFEWIGDDARAVSAEEVDREFHASPPILMADEKAEIAFKCGRDLFVISNKRFLKVDTQGWSGQRVEYLTIPLKVCNCFSITSAGKFDFDGETSVSTDIPDRDEWGNTWSWTVEQDLRKGKTDMMTVQEWLSTKLLKKGVAEV